MLLQNFPVLAGNLHILRFFFSPTHNVCTFVFFSFGLSWGEQWEPSALSIPTPTCNTKTTIRLPLLWLKQFLFHCYFITLSPFRSLCQISNFSPWSLATELRAQFWGIMAFRDCASSQSQNGWGWSDAKPSLSHYTHVQRRQQDKCFPGKLSICNCEV